MAWLGTWVGGSRTSVAWVLANLAGVGLYPWGAAHAWAIPAERAAGITTVSGEPFVWAAFVLPVWAVFGVVNVLWAGATLASPPRRRELGGILVVGAAWALAVAIDFAHH